MKQNTTTKELLHERIEQRTQEELFVVPDPVVLFLQPPPFHNS